MKGFGIRLTQVRKIRGLTQAELSRASGVSRRMIVYYEQDNAQPPGAVIVALASALRVSADELLGLKTPKETLDIKSARLFKRLQKIQSLPRADQRAVLKVLDALASTRRRASRVA